MMSEKQFIESQKECASMLGMTLSEYQNYCNDVKVPKIDVYKKQKYDNKILSFLGLKPKDLKKRKG